MQRQQRPKLRQPKKPKAQQQPKVQQQPKQEQEPMAWEAQALELGVQEAEPRKLGHAPMLVGSSRRNTTRQWLSGMGKDMRYMANFAALLEDGVQQLNRWCCRSLS